MPKKRFYYTIYKANNGNRRSEYDMYYFRLYDGYSLKYQSLGTEFLEMTMQRNRTPSSENDDQRPYGLRIEISYSFGNPTLAVKMLNSFNKERDWDCSYKKVISWLHKNGQLMAQHKKRLDGGYEITRWIPHEFKKHPQIYIDAAENGLKISR